MSSTPKRVRRLGGRFLTKQNGHCSPKLMAELDDIKKRAISGHIFRRDHGHRRSATPLPWISARGDLDYVRSVVKQIIRAAGLRDELSFTSFRHGGFTEGADSDLTDAELRDRLRVRVPDYMIPARFVALASMPLTPRRLRSRAPSGTRLRSEPRPCRGQGSRRT